MKLSCKTILSFFYLDKVRSFKFVITHSLQQFHENDLFTPAAAMSYYALLTLFPALLVLLAIGDRFSLGDQLLFNIIAAYPGSQDFLHGTVTSLHNVGTGAIVSCAVIVLWASSWMFNTIERAVNRIWETTPRTLLRSRAISIGMIFVIGLLLTASVLFTSVLVALRRFASDLSPMTIEMTPQLVRIGGLFWQSILALGSLALTVTLFVLIYRFMPNLGVRLTEILPGAMLAGLLWELAKYLFAVSLHLFSYDQIYGSVGAVIAVLTWSYVSSLILLFGAQLTAVLTAEHRNPKLAFGHRKAFVVN
ncbi:MAG: YihY/virulence factor BrkB family protein [Pyrinomonadaceae bacterium]